MSAISINDRLSRLARALLLSDLSFFGAVTIVWLTFFAIYSRALTNNDVAWFLTGTSKWLNGERLYRDVIEVNPPLVFYLDILPVIISNWTGIPVGSVFVAYIFTIVACIYWLCAKVLSGCRISPIERRALLLCCLCAMVMYALQDFGQREHLAIILSLPYLCLIAARGIGVPSEKWLTAVIGAIAAIGFCLKPQFLSIPVALEAYMAFRLGSAWNVNRIELRCLCAVVIAYVVSIITLTPDYLTRVVPYALLVYNKGYSAPFMQVLLQWQTVGIVLVPVACYLSRARQRWPELANVFLIAAVIFYLIYVSELKGWTYQILPVTALSFLAMASAIVTGGRPAFGAATLCFMLAVPYFGNTYRNPTVDLLAPIVAKRLDGGGLFVFSSYVWLGFPLAGEVGARWPSRFPALWLLPGAEQGLQSVGSDSDQQRRQRYVDVEQYTRDSVIDDFKKDPPTVVIVDKTIDPRFPGSSGFDYLSFFCKDPRFESIWEGYKWFARVQTNGIGPYDVYTQSPIANPHSEDRFTKPVADNAVRDPRDLDQSAVPKRDLLCGGHV